MKVLAVNTSDIKGGAARAAYRLHTGLKQTGVDSRMLVDQKQANDRTVIGPLSTWEKWLRYGRSKVDTIPLRTYCNRQPQFFSAAWVPNDLRKKVLAVAPDVVHLHWVRMFLRIETLRAFEYPVVWTMHDMWPFTGGCHYDNDCNRFQDSCGRCPVLGSDRDNDLSRKVWKRKLKAWNNLTLTIVAPSRWLAACARASSLFGQGRIEVIPNGLDINRYKPVNKKVAREMFFLPQDKKLILYGAINATSDQRKGFQFLQSALQGLARNGWGERAELVVFGADKPTNPPDLGLKANYTGKLNDDISLNLLYAAADVFVAPSVQDNLPNTVMESLACGTPCVAFNIGGMPDMIEHGQTGYLVRPYEVDDLAKGILWMLENDQQRQSCSFQARAKVEREFALDAVAGRYMALYADILEQREKNQNNLLG